MDLQQFQQLAERRRTLKVMSDHPLPSENLPAGTLQALLASAGWAPFHRASAPEHRPNDQLQGVEPWRFYVLESQSCRKLGRRIADMPAAGKIPAMLATSHALILATWLPSSATTDRSGEMSQVDTEYFDPSLVNVEHIAAASAAVQSLLLAATAAGIESYWSSGGVLRQPELFSQLSIPGNQRLLGAVFLFPPQLPSGVPGELATSKLRLQRGPITAWTRFVQLD